MNVNSERYCPHCGAGIRTDANFCEQCGEQIDPPPESGPQNPAADSRPEGHSREQAVQEGRPNNPPSQPHEQNEAVPPDQPARIPDHYGHLFGDVYYDKRARYVILEVTGAILMLLPPGVFGDIFRTPLQWLLENNPRVLLWVIQNYQMIGLGILFAGIASRITIDPNQIQIEQAAGEGANEDSGMKASEKAGVEAREGTDKEANNGAGLEASKGAGEEANAEDKSFFTLYWLGLD